MRRHLEPYCFMPMFALLIRQVQPKAMQGSHVPDAQERPCALPPCSFWRAALHAVS